MIGFMCDVLNGACADPDGIEDIMCDRVRVPSEDPLLAYARREFSYLPQTDAYDLALRDAVMEVLEVISRQGHSGASIGPVLAMLRRLALFQPLSPLTLRMEEFGAPYDMDGTRQNMRRSSIFMDKDGRVYDIDAYSCMPVARKEFGSDLIVPNDKKICWSSHPFLMLDGYPTGTEIKRCCIKTPGPSGYSPADKVILPCLEVEPQKDWWEFYVDIESPEYQKLLELYDVEVVYSTNPPTLMGQCVKW